MSGEWIVYLVTSVLLVLLAMKTYGHIEERKAQISAKMELDKAQVYANQRTAQARLDGLTDIRLAGINSTSGDDSELDEAMKMLGMFMPGMQGHEEMSTPLDTDSVSSDLHKFAQTEKGQKAMDDFKEWKATDGL